MSSADERIFNIDRKRPENSKTRDNNPAVDKKVIFFYITCIFDFAREYNLTIKDAYNYLKEFEGIKYLLEYIIRDVVGIISSERKLPIDEAMDIFFNSDVFEKLQDIKSGLYTESASYIYEML